MAEVAFAHLSLQEYLCAEAIAASDDVSDGDGDGDGDGVAGGAPAAGALWLRPVEWGARWDNVLRLGLKLGPRFGRALARVQGVNLSANSAHTCVWHAPSLVPVTSGAL